MFVKYFHIVNFGVTCYTAPNVKSKTETDPLTGTRLLQEVKEKSI